MNKELESIIKQLEESRRTLERDRELTWEGMDAILRFIIIKANEMIKNEMEAKEDGNIKQKSIGSCKGDC